MENTVLRAKLILGEHFDIDIKNFDNHYTRKRSVVEARRFLVYFLRNDLELTYYEILKHIPSLTNHASVIHHYKRMVELIELEKPLKTFYGEFIEKVMGSQEILVEQEVMALTLERKQINKQINKLKKLL